MQAVRPVVRQMQPKGTLSRLYHAEFKPPTMNDMPQPSGSWKELNAARQAKYNKHLILGSGFFALTIGVAVSSGLVRLNWSRPDRPADRE